MFNEFYHFLRNYDLQKFNHIAQALWSNHASLMTWLILMNLSFIWVSLLFVMLGFPPLCNVRAHTWTTSILDGIENRTVVELVLSLKNALMLPATFPLPFLNIIWVHQPTIIDYDFSSTYSRSYCFFPVFAISPTILFKMYDRRPLLPILV